jgi:hypothetical protein
MARVFVRTRVVNLKDVPWFLVVSEGLDFEGDSWTVQCEILQSTLLGPGDVNPHLFDFFSFGQRGQGPLGPAPPVQGRQQPGPNQQQQGPQL